jgi:protein TonB
MLNENILFGTATGFSKDERSRRGWTALTSFGLQALAVGSLLVLPLLRTVGLPLFRPVSAPIILGRPLAEVSVNRTSLVANRSVSSNPTDVVWRQPSRIPALVAMDAGDEGAPTISSMSSTGLGATGPGLPQGMRDTFGTGAIPIMPVAVKPVMTPLRISHMSEGDLVHKVLPAYPPLARSARIQGAVVLQAMISKQGSIENLKTLSGQPMLVASAIDAVRQWRYRPYILNGEAMEVETQITVTFSLEGN